MTATWFVVYHTAFGRVVRAGVQNPDVVGALGISLAPYMTAIAALGVGLAGLAGVLLAVAHVAGAHVAAAPALARPRGLAARARRDGLPRPRLPRQPDGLQQLAVGEALGEGQLVALQEVHSEVLAAGQRVTTFSEGSDQYDVALRSNRRAIGS